MVKINSAYLCDGYKVDHRRQYPNGTTMVYSNFTPRSNHYANGIDKLVVFGIQYFIMAYLIDHFDKNFFYREESKVTNEFTRRINNYLGPNQVSIDHIKALHKLRFMPVEIRALPEGVAVPMRVPVLTIHNTIPEFFWVTNFLETIMSCILWQPMTSASIARQYLKEFIRHSDLTGSPKDFIQWQGHDFSFRGMPGLEAAMLSGAGHLLAFTGTDTIPAIDFLEKYYQADSDEELIGGSVAATEHSVMCMGGLEDEFGTFKRLITEVYPEGLVSIVSDTWDFWQVMTDFLPRLKDIIINRPGRVVIRPDSGDPVNIVCGLESPRTLNTPEYKGAYEILWDIFGGTINEKGYKVLHPNIGLIYGDSITMERQREILQKLEDKGFTASNLVLGIGSFTYTYNTRDTFALAMKATYGEVNGEPRIIFKDPKTDSGMKKSAVGLLAVLKDDKGEYYAVNNATPEQMAQSELKTVFKDGELVKSYSLYKIRKNLKDSLNE